MKTRSARGRKGTRGGGNWYDWMLGRPSASAPASAPASPASAPAKKSDWSFFGRSATKPKDTYCIRGFKTIVEDIIDGMKYNLDKTSTELKESPELTPEFTDIEAYVRKYVESHLHNYPNYIGKCVGSGSKVLYGEDHQGYRTSRREYFPIKLVSVENIALQVEDRFLSTQGDKFVLDQRAKKENRQQRENEEAKKKQEQQARRAADEERARFRKFQMDKAAAALKANEDAEYAKWLQDQSTAATPEQPIVSQNLSGGKFRTRGRRNRRSRNRKRD